MYPLFINFYCRDLDSHRVRNSDQFIKAHAAFPVDVDKQQETAKAWTRSYRSFDDGTIKNSFTIEKVRNEAFYNVRIFSIDYRAGKVVYKALIDGKYVVDLHEEPFYDIIQNSSITNGIINDPLFFAVRGSRLQLILRDGYLHKEIIKKRDYKNAPIITSFKKYYLYSSDKENFIYCGSVNGIPYFIKFWKMTSLSDNYYTDPSRFTGYILPVLPKSNKIKEEIREVVLPAETIRILKDIYNIT